MAAMLELPGQPGTAPDSPAAGTPGKKKLKQTQAQAQEDLQRKMSAKKTYEKIQLKGAQAMEQGPTAALYEVWQRLDSNGNGLLSWSEFAGVSAALGVQWDLKTAWEDALEIMEMHEADRLLRERLASTAQARGTADTSLPGAENGALQSPSFNALQSTSFHGTISLTDDDAEAAKMVAAQRARGRNRGRNRREGVLTLLEDPDIDNEEKARRAKEAAKQGWAYNLTHLRGKDSDSVQEISFRAFVSVYNETMGQARRRVRLEIKTMFERMVHDTGGISVAGFHKLCSRSTSRLYLLAPGWESEKDWRLLLDLSGLEERADDVDLTISWAEFERWWKHRMGLMEADTPVIPEFFEFKMEELSAAERAKSASQRRVAAKKLPKAFKFKVNGKQKEVDLSSLVANGFDEQRSGKDLWALLRPRLRMLLTMRKDWGNIDDIYGHSDSSFGQVPLPMTIRDPESKFSSVWDALQVIFLFYVSWTVPLRACFGIEIEIPSPEWVIDSVVDLYFIADLMLNFSTAFVDGNGIRQTSRRVIMREYLRGWFCVDFVSCIPVQYITMAIQETQGVGEGNNYRAFKALRLIRLSKMLRLARIKRMMEKYERLEFVQNYGGIFFLSYGIFFIAHILSCLWYMVGLSDHHQTSSFTMTIPGWVLSEWCNDKCEFGQLQLSEATAQAMQQGQQSAPLCLSFPSEQACMATDRCQWSEREGYGNKAHCNPRQYCKIGCEVARNPKLWDRYVTSLWSVFGSIDPDVAQTPPERFFAVFAYVCLVIIDGAVAGVLSAVMISMGGKEREVYDRLRSAKLWMREQRIPKAKAQKALDYFRMVYKSRVMYEEGEIMETMPPAMKLEFASHLYFKFLSATPLFQGLPVALLHSLCTIMEPMLAVRGQIIYTQGSSGTEMYLLLSGELEITHVDSLGLSQRLGFLSDGAFFGETPILDDSSSAEIRRRTVVAVTDCKLCFIRRVKMVALKEVYPELALRLMRCTRTEDHRVNKKGKKYRAALYEAGILLKTMDTLAMPGGASYKERKQKRDTTNAGNAGGVPQSAEAKENALEEHQVYESVRLSNLENMMMEQGRVLAEIRSELQMISHVDQGYSEPSVSRYRAP